MEKIGIAGNGIFPVLFAREARARGYRVVAEAHVGESLREIDGAADSVDWIRVGQIARLIRVFRASDAGEGKTKESAGYYRPARGGRVSCQPGRGAMFDGPRGWAVPGRNAGRPPPNE